MKVFVDVDSDVRLARRMLRNLDRYDRTPEFEVEQYFDKVKPMHQKYVEPCKEYADVIMPFYENSKKSIALLTQMIQVTFDIFYK